MPQKPKHVQKHKVKSVCLNRSQKGAIHAEIICFSRILNHLKHFIKPFVIRSPIGIPFIVDEPDTVESILL